MFTICTDVRNGCVWLGRMPEPRSKVGTCKPTASTSEARKVMRFEPPSSMSGSVINRAIALLDSVHMYVYRYHDTLRIVV